jgi:uncharacterized protein (DUF2236 family)
MRDVVTRRVNAERLVVLGWSRAILLQLAHPLVAAGVADHSSFRGGSRTSVLRLHRTIRAMLALTFGDARAHGAALDDIRAIHRRVHGRLPETVGIYPAGTPYSAEDPELVLWVHLTLVESLPLVYERAVRPLTAAERDAYCAEAAEVAVELGARPGEVPRTWADAEAQLDCAYRSGAIAVGRQARTLAAAVLAPPYAPLVAPLAGVNRLVTVGLLPPAIRGAYGLSWNDGRDDRRLARAFERLRTLRRVLPRRIALWPEAR